jgi:PTH2 family peptidyl-tRNA hydrolase
MWKQVIVVRKDLKLGKGKIAAQVAHASLESYKKAGHEDRLEWESRSSKKVVVKAENLEELLDILKSARKAKLPHALIRDAGRTEVEPGTVTALGIGPCEEGKADRITGHLPML